MQSLTKWVKGNNKIRRGGGGGGGGVVGGGAWWPWAARVYKHGLFCFKIKKTQAYWSGGCFNFFYLVIIASNHKSLKNHRLFIWPWHLVQPIINWFDFCFFVSIYPHKNVYTGQLVMKDWCTHSMAIQNIGPRWQDKKRCCKSQSAFRTGSGSQAP